MKIGSDEHTPFFMRHRRQHTHESGQYGISAYDGVYVALADSLHVPLLTADHPAVTHLSSSPYHLITAQQLFGPPR